MLRVLDKDGKSPLESLNVCYKIDFTPDELSKKAHFHLKFLNQFKP